MPDTTLYVVEYSRDGENWAPCADEEHDDHIEADVFKPTAYLNIIEAEQRRAVMHEMFAPSIHYRVVGYRHAD